MCECIDSSKKIKLKNLEMSDTDRELYRPYLKVRSISKKFANYGPKYKLIFSNYLKLVPLSVQAKIVRCLHGGYNLCEDCLLLKLKQISNHCLERIINRGISDLIYLLDLGNLTGFDTTQNRVDPLTTLRNEFGVKSLTLPNQQLLDEIDRTISMISVKKVEHSFEQFVAFRDAWANPGVSNLGSAAKITFKCDNQLKDRVVKNKNKWFASLSMSDEQIVEECNSTRVEVKPFIKKDEPARARTIMAYDTRSIIRCSYMEEAVKSWNGNGLWTSVGMTPADKLSLRERIVAFNGQRDLVKICTDQSQFDINQPLWAVTYAYKRLIDHLSEGQDYSFKKIASLELESLLRVRLLEGENTFAWKKGLLSGCKWTAILGSILNCSASRMVMKNNGMKDVFSIFQGDDALIVTDREISRDTISEHYSELGMKVNASKSWISRNRCEYLHEIYDGDTVYAFPARIARALIWKKPSVGIEVGGGSAINNLIDVCRKASRRGLCGMQDYVRRLLKSYSDVWDETKFLQCFRTPTVIGGLGFGDSGRTKINIESEFKSGSNIQLDSQNCTGYNISLLKSAIIVRMQSLGMPIPNMKTKISYSKIKSVQTSSIKYTISASAGKIRTTWNLSDYATENRPYLKKLILEKKLLRREEITKEDIPRSVLSYSQLNIDKAFRLYTRWSSQVFNLSSYINASESWARLIQFGNRAWAGLVNMAAHAMHDIFESTPPDMGKEFSIMCQWVMEMANTTSVSVKVRV
uniref:RNA-directed RNA polymerase n=1 Tax=Conidiobolus lamprauges totivirus 1 TaxID=2980980 RepID=A0A977R5I2_9VIRU|nr:RNA-dependent RNA polymerase [Conidiobolus lamprauges totivirus 1]